MTKRSTPEHFWSMVRVGEQDECWPWLKHVDKTTGYGRLMYQGKTWKPHRLAHYLTNGVLTSPNLHMMHLCNNPICCNPKHLRPGTTKENIQMASRDGLMRMGERHPRAKLTDEIVRAIRSSAERPREIRKRFDVTYSQISTIRAFRCWKHVKALGDL